MSENDYKRMTNQVAAKYICPESHQVEECINFFDRNMEHFKKIGHKKQVTTAIKHLKNIMDIIGDLNTSVELGV